LRQKAVPTLIFLECVAQMAQINRLPNEDVVVTGWKCHHFHF
jgi:hypothetical protein